MTEENGPNDPADRRKHIRVDFDSSVEVRSADRTLIAGKPFSISLGGVGVIGQNPMPVGTDCHVTIYFNGASSDLCIQAEGSVVRSGPLDDNGIGSMGVEFTSIDEDGYFHLKNLILYNSDDPDSVEAEF